MAATRERSAVAPDALLDPAHDLVTVIAVTKARILRNLTASSYWAENVKAGLPSPPAPIIPASMLRRLDFDDEPEGVISAQEFVSVDESDDSAW